MNGKLVLNRFFRGLSRDFAPFPRAAGVKPAARKGLLRGLSTDSLLTKSGQLEPVQHRMLAVKNGQLAASGKNVRRVTAVFVDHRWSGSVLPEVP